MKQNLALEIMMSGESVLLTGAAGSGKTYVLNRFIRAAKKAGKKVAITATTGLAATHLNGTTIHAWSGIGIHRSLPPRYAEGLSQSRRDTIATTDVLIIDEISMLHDYRLDMVDAIARAVRHSAEPFGGIQIILCGDFFQLPPVNRGDEQGRFVVESFVWEELKPVVCYLDEQHRQDDDEFLDILNAMRAGDIRRRHAEKLVERQNAELGYGQDVTELHTTNLDVDALNQTQLNALQAPSRFYEMTTSGKANYLETLRKSCLAVEKLELKKGALVMCIRNSQDKKYVNGSLGVIKDFEEPTGWPIVELRTGKVVTIGPDSWELRDGDTKRASISQIPLRLAWAITVHKSQGMTLDAARINLARAFVEGMGYVALSRVRSLTTLSLTGLNQMALKVSPAALTIEAELRARSAEAEKKFAGLEKKAKERVEKDELPDVVKGGSWQDRINEMRKDYPRAYTPWLEGEDEKLKQLFESGKGLKDITIEMQRQPGGITARLKKHFGEEVAIPK